MSKNIGHDTMIELEFYDIDIRDNLAYAVKKDSKPLCKYITHSYDVKSCKWGVGQLLYATPDGCLSSNGDKPNMPVGICVIPSDFLPGDPSPRFMSLDDLCLDHVYNIGWGPINNDVPNVENRLCIPNILAIKALVNTDRYFSSCTGYRTFVASDMFNSNEIPYSNLALGNTAENGLAPEPCLWDTAEDGSEYCYYNNMFNVMDLNGDHVDNVLAYFNGEELTREIMKDCTNVPEKYPAYVNQHGWYPASYACAKFKTMGTEEGDWYLPSIAELVVMYANVSKINKVLKDTKRAYEVLTDSVYWSSTPGTNWGAFFLKMSLGGINVEYKTFAYTVRAFMKIK